MSTGSSSGGSGVAPSAIPPSASQAFFSPAPALAPPLVSQLTSSSPPPAADSAYLSLPQPSSFPPLSILQSLEGKVVFLTGGTGFVGKVIVEKLLRSAPNIGRILMLVRPRKGSTAEERLKAEVVDSEIFTRLRKEIGEEAFAARARSKLQALGGEMTQHGVGLRPDDYELLLRSVDVIIHCAAIVDFNERLDRAIELNVLGSLRLLAIARQCSRLAAFVHVSTCYVNSNRRGWMDERLYPLGFDAEEMLRRVQAMKETELEKITVTQLLGDWPNTYTFTKAMTEHLMVKARGSVPLAIVRPSIVGGSAREPVPGWVDVISAAGAVYLSVGLGVLKFLPGSEHNMADVVPVDYVVNVVLGSIPAIAHQSGRVLVLHAATSSERPMYWGNACQVVVKYFVQHPAARRLAPPSFRMIASPQNYQIQFFLNYSVPSALLNSLSPIAPKAYQVKAQQFDRLVFRARIIVQAFRHFVENEWQFNNSTVRAIGQSLPERERELFPLDLSEFDWDEYNYYFAHGLMRYVLKSDLNPIPPDHLRTYNVNETPWKPRPATGSALRDWLPPLFPDLSYSSQLWKSRSAYPPPRPLEDMRRLILASPAIQRAIKAENDRVKAQASSSPRPSSRPSPRTGSSSGASSQSLLTPGELRARSIMDKMFGETSLPVLQGMGFLFKKVWKRIYDVIAVEAAGLNAARAAAKQGPLILIPTHRSYVDFLIVSYCCFALDLPIPHIAAGEDFLGILLVRWLFRRSGAFFMKRSMDSAADPLYAAIFGTYLQQLLVDGQSIEFFIEGTRSRSGKMLQPKQGLLSVLTDAYLDGRLSDAFLVPISINYEKTMEGEIYSNELLGESKIRESLRSLLSSSSVLNGNFGSIAVNFAQPISIREYTQQSMRRHRDTPAMQQPPVPSFDAVNGALTLAENGVAGQRPKPAPRTALLPLDAAAGLSSVSPLSTSPSAAPAPTSAFPAPPPSPASSSSPSSFTFPVRTDGSYDPYHDRAARKYLSYCLSYDIVYALSCQSVVMPTSIVASLLLMYRQGISHSQLVQQTDWVRRQLQERGAKTLGLQGEDRSLLVDRALHHLGAMVRERRKAHYEPAIASREEYRNMLVLGHYRNKLLHHFYREGLWACALYAFGDAAETGVKQSRLLTEVSFLHSLLQREFIVKPDPGAPEDFEATLETMIGRRILLRERRTRSQQSEHTRQQQQQHSAQHLGHADAAAEEAESASSTAVNAYVDDVGSLACDVYVEVSPSGEGSFSFLCALFWPFIDSYYAACMTLFSLQPEHRIDEASLLQRTQWLATTLYAESMLSFYESSSMDTLRNAFEVLKVWGVIAKQKLGNTQPGSAGAGESGGPAAGAGGAAAGGGGSGDGGSKVVVYLLGVYREEAGLQQLVNRIGRLRKQPPVRKTAGRRNLIADIPILAKL